MMSTPKSDEGEQISTPDSEVMVIGPPKAGKTVYLSAVVLAADKNWKFEHGLNESDKPSPGAEQPADQKRVAVFPVNMAMRNLANEARRTIVSGFPSFAATSGVTEYDFDLELSDKSNDVPQRRWFGALNKSTDSTRFRVIDGPGGSIFQSAAIDANNGVHQDESNMRERLVSQAKRSQGILICLDASDEKMAASFFFDLPELFSEIHPRRLPFKRIVLLLTKAEKVVANKRGADKSLIAIDPRSHLNRILPDTVLANIFKWKDRNAEVCCGWASAYGFIPNEGSPNYEKIDDRTAKLRSVQPHMTLNHKLKLWMPFRILDPLVYLAGGSPGSLKPIKQI